MKYFKIRITFTDENQLDGKKIQSILDNRCDAYILCFEVGSQGERAHCHIYAESSFTYNTIKSDISKIAKSKMGRGDWSFGVLVEDENDPEFMSYKCYCVKGGDYVIKNIPNIDEIVVQEKKNQEEMKEKKKKKKSKSQLKMFIEIFDEMFEMTDRGVAHVLEKTYLEYVPSPSKLTPTGMRVVDLDFLFAYVYQYYIDNDMLIRQFYIVSLVQTLASRYYPYYRTIFKNKVMESLKERLH